MAIILGRIVGTIYFVIIYFSVYVKKGLNSFKYIIMGTIAAILTVFIGLIIPLIFAANLTTKECKIETDEGIQ